MSLDPVENLEKSVDEEFKKILSWVNGEITSLRNDLEKVVTVAKDETASLKSDLGKGLTDAKNETASLVSGVGKGLINAENRITSLAKDLENIPETLKKKIMDERGATMAKIAVVYDDAKDIIADAFIDIGSHVAAYEAWKKAGTEIKFKNDLVEFIENLFAVPENVVKLLTTVHFDVSDKTVSELINAIPDFILYALWLGLRSHDVKGGEPTWLTYSVHIRTLSNNIQSRAAIENLVKEDTKKLLPTIEKGLTDLKLVISILNPTIELIKSLLPEDFSINADILGEGGGTEVAGHPVKIPFNLIAWVTSMAVIAADEILGMISDAAKEEAQKKQADDMNTILAYIATQKK